ncbi:hypothetical protein PG987_014063, partial [Apiospora arundinis]
SLPSSPQQETCMKCAALDNGDPIIDPFSPRKSRSQSKSNDRVDTVLGVPEPHKFDRFPNVKAWHERMNARPSWQRSM